MVDVSEYLYLIRATRPEMLRAGPTVRESEILSRHAAYLDDLVRRGVGILYGRTRREDPSDFGVVIFRAGSEEDARRIMEKDPAVKEGVMAAELYPYRIAGMIEPRVT